jgi:ubiquitin C-terminal hydrolase
MSKDHMTTHKFECKLLKQRAAAAATAPAAVTAVAAKPPYLDPAEDAPVPQQVLFPYAQYLQLHRPAGRGSSGSASASRPPAGFVNQGNCCYANAALQCLLVTQPLRAYLDRGLHSSGCRKPSAREWCLLCELQVRA